MMIVGMLSACGASQPNPTGLLLGYSMVKRRGGKLARFAESLACHVINKYEEPVASIGLIKEEIFKVYKIESTFL